MKGNRILCDRSGHDDPAAASKSRARISARHLAAWLLCTALAGLPAWADNEPLLRLEPAPGHAGQRLPLAHPATISADELARALGVLDFVERGLLGRSSRNPVFGSDEVAVLSPLLAEALGRAEASEQVRFASFSRRGGTLSQLLKTEAVSFIDGEGLLNVAFVGIHEFAGADVDFFDFLALSDRDPLVIDRSLLRLADDTPGWTVREDRPLWTRHDPTTPLPADPTPAPTAAPAAPEPVAPPAAAEADESTPAIAAPPAAPGTLEAEIRQRLEFLKRLYEDGLITEEEYEGQRREALRRLE